MKPHECKKQEMKEVCSKNVLVWTTAVRQGQGVPAMTMYLGLNTTSTSGSAVEPVEEDTRVNCRIQCECCSVSCWSGNINFLKIFLQDFLWCPWSSLASFTTEAVLVYHVLVCPLVCWWCEEVWPLEMWL